jgi:hypothetical protein
MICFGSGIAEHEMLFHNEKSFPLSFSFQQIFLCEWQNFYIFMNEQKAKDTKDFIMW